MGEHESAFERRESFKRIYASGSWSEEGGSLSGPGSEIWATGNITKILGVVVEAIKTRFGVRKIR